MRGINASRESRSSSPRTTPTWSAGRGGS
jgi:hypothetical protein